MKRLLLLNEDPRQRLQLSTFLTGHYDVLNPQPGEDPLKTARLLTPDLVFLTLHPYRPDDTLRLCRMLKTDLAPIRHVAIYASGSGPPPEEVLGPFLADGYMGGPIEPKGLLSFLDSVQRGEKPCVSPPPPPHGFLRKLLHRLRA
jgi:DNA-binding response OmpR family regulator